MRGAWPLLAALALAGCGPEPQPASPALWQVEGSGGQRAWLFGTIHSLDRPARWRSPAIDRALGQADRIVVEVADLDPAILRATFIALSQSPGLPPLSQRVAPELRPRLDALLKKVGAREAQFARVETWAAALSLARAGQSADDAVNGIDRAVIAQADKRPVVELEGARGQLAIFDGLPEREQRDLLAAVLRDADAIDADSSADAWLHGDMRAIEAETREGLLADAELREALFTGRNRAWSARVARMLKSGEHPFVAVGAAHMAGGEGLPALLTARGFTVTRVQ